MVAKSAVMPQSPDTVVLEMESSMQEYASVGDWEKVGELALRIQSAIMQVPERRRGDAILAARSSMEQVRSLARNARNDVASQLFAIRRGKEATKAYVGSD